MFSPAGDALIKIGKEATNKLIPLLNDTSKGIIAHYILSDIWSEKLINAGVKMGSGVSFTDNKQIYLTLVHNGFVFFKTTSEIFFRINLILLKIKKSGLHF
jgi:hypothetical protein